MNVKALIGFSGLNICMSVGEEQDISDDALLEDLLRAGYVEPAQQVLRDNGLVEEIKPINNEPTTGETPTGETVTEEPTTEKPAIVDPGNESTTTEEPSTVKPTSDSKKNKPIV